MAELLSVLWRSKFVHNIIPKVLDGLSDFVVSKTGFAVIGRHQYVLRIIILMGPIFFLPTLYEVWTAENIEVFRTATWPLMLIVHIAFFVSISHHRSDWCARLCTIIWFLITLLIVIATIVR